MRGIFKRKRYSLNWVGRCGAFLLIVLGAFVACTELITDYARGFTATDGIYIPNAYRNAASSHLPQSNEFTYVFKIYNLRPRYLSVEAEPDCGCTAVSWRKATVPPFGWKTFTAKMAVSKVDGVSSKKSAAVSIHTSSRENPYV